MSRPAVAAIRWQLAVHLNPLMLQAEGLVAKQELLLFFVSLPGCCMLMPPASAFSPRNAVKAVSVLWRQSEVALLGDVAG